MCYSNDPGWMTSILISTCFHHYHLYCFFISGNYYICFSSPSGGEQFDLLPDSSECTTLGKDVGAWKCLPGRGGGPRVCKLERRWLNHEQFWWCFSSTEWFVGYTEMQAMLCCRSTAWECNLPASCVIPPLAVLLLLLLLLLPDTWKGHFTVAARKYWS